MKLALVAVCLLVACGSSTAPVRPSPPTPASTVVAPVDDALLAQAGIDRAALYCNSENRWGGDLRSDAVAGAGELVDALGTAAPTADAARAELKDHLRSMLFWRMVRAVLIEGNNNNLGAVPLTGYTWTDATGKVRPVVVFRSGITPAPEAEGSCFRSLLEHGLVRHVVNLFDGKIPVADLVAAEGRAAKAAGATYVTATDEEGTGYGRWRDTLKEHYDDPAQRAAAFSGIARLIREQILAPGGAPPRGNIHLHCGGGMHRSGMITGVIEKCVNHAPMAQVLAHYRYHVAWHDDAHPGGYEAGNEQVLQDFDCELLSAGPAATPAP